VLESACALYEAEPDFDWASLESRLNDKQRELLSHIVIADSSGETMSPEQAMAYLDYLRAQEHTAQAELKSRIMAAERAGDMNEAMRLMQLASRPAARRQIRQGSG
jgi:hypothetical protein